MVKTYLLIAGLVCGLGAQAASSQETAQASPQIEDNLLRPGDPFAGKMRYNLCANCHGIDAEGIESIGAPKLNGLNDWYLRHQLGAFMNNIRASNTDNRGAQMMRVMATTIPDEQAVEDLVAYLTSLPNTTDTDNTVEGDAEVGAALYQPCALCHGQQAEGDQNMGGPSLTGQDPWYLKLQLENFKSGLRGANPKDQAGARMMPMARVLVDEQAIDDVVAYIATLTPKVNDPAYQPE
ncbi:MAG: hypothetical protein CMK07_08530 [Ponticaulis sp.]|nr:hypothetical protein [Ponticaulis sp.]